MIDRFIAFSLCVSEEWERIHRERCEWSAQLLAVTVRSITLRMAQMLNPAVVVAIILFSTMKLLFLRRVFHRTLQLSTLIQLDAILRQGTQTCRHQESHDLWKT